MSPHPARPEPVARDCSTSAVGADDTDEFVRSHARPNAWRGRPPHRAAGPGELADAVLEFTARVDDEQA
ncbi:hypothetical protein [Streptomyces sp. NPDC088115]|uniref:hypothetical protein n=1 Tax=Streptomyces sp. NPDC088115 TaxID=3365824 RepID=UPI0038284799